MKNVKNNLVKAAVAVSMISPVALTSVAASANVAPGNNQVRQERVTDQNKQQRPNADKTKSANNAQVQAPRLTGSEFKSENRGQTTSVSAPYLLNVLKYNVKTYTDGGADSGNPFSIRIYKNGNLYKTISSDNGTLSGSLLVGKGNYTIKVYTTNNANHFTGGLSL